MSIMNLINFLWPEKRKTDVRSRPARKNLSLPRSATMSAVMLVNGREFISRKIAKQAQSIDIASCRFK